MDFSQLESKLSILNQIFKGHENSKQYIYAKILKELVDTYHNTSISNAEVFFNNQDSTFDDIFDSFYEKEIYGLLSKNEAKSLFYLSKQIKGTILEIGTFLGYSSCLMGQNADKIYCVDLGYDNKMHHNDYVPFHMFYNSTRETDKIPSNIPKLEICKKNWNIANVIDKINIINMNSNDAIDFTPNQVDMLWIDGDHSYEGCLNDLNNYWDKLRSGGVLAVHDFVNAISSSGVVGAVHEFYQLHQNELSDPYSADMVIWFYRK